MYDLILKKILETHKSKMQKKAENIFEGKEKAHFKAVYTELFITEGDMKEVHQEHEILKIDDAFNKNKQTQDKPIKCNDIFILLRENNEKKIVLTKGVAGIGKTVSVHKFILDWAEGEANQNIHCVFLLPFREINLMTNEDFSLHKLLLELYPELEGLEKTKLYKECNLAFIFDGLDESRLTLNFKTDLILKKILETHKSKMQKKAENIFEGKEKAHFKAVYTELFITEGDMKEVHQEHEILKIDDAFNKNKQTQDKPIKCNDIFILLRENNEKKIVLTKGVAGIGKTVSVHKFILDWAEGKANQDIHCVFLLPFREINLMTNEDFSLHELLLEFYPDLEGLEKTKLYKECNLVFIFDGLDESRLALNFKTRTSPRAIVEKRSSVAVLFTGLVKGTLLPSALVWVTSRPAAANQIPPEHVGLFTEVRGFTDQQKEQYFRKRITDETLAPRIISHIKTSRSLYISEKDLKECGIDVSKDIEFTGMIAEIFKKENVLHYKKVFSFVHLSVQEFLAAVHVFLCYLNKKMQELQFFFDEPEENVTLQELLQKAVDKAMESKRGHLDLFLRFLMGITLESSQNLLQGLITHTEDTTESIRQTTEHIKQVQNKNISDEASVNLFYCLLELKDLSLYEEIQRYLSSDAHPGRDLSSAMCSVLTYILLMSEKVLDEFNPKRFTSSQKNYNRLIPAVRCCGKALWAVWL
ncbi:protein NLRC3-like [Sinocyclocheilus rhinocerous]|uniref:protein NLRC3-like n=1 Tax=Sinocyclocheilus rhinocerous TaxID=307959 RepID=UPI0007BA597B|nr:PREDICTED: protein NLRC3-like [Sinocyclocheilus rhinocerous]